MTDHIIAILAGWVVLSIPLALVVGRMLRRASDHYPLVLVVDEAGRQVAVRADQAWRWGK